uniref:Cytochrome P450 n=1 Tax=Azadirachta indica TaxID=124943 RepID=A0A7G9U7L9_AZAIN|nr:cytochrome P450 [Azadirachta indica]
MDTLHYLALLVSILLIVYQHIRRNKIPHKNLPPSPPGLPIIGHFHVLKNPINQTLNNLSNKYGPILLLRLGSRPVLVVSSRSAIEECLTKNDIIFANRPRLPSRKIEHNLTGLGAPYGDLWRNLRRFSVLEIFSSKRLQLSASNRTEEIRLMTKHLFKSTFEGFREVDVKSLLYKLDFNIMMKMVTGKRCFEEEELATDIAKDKLDKLNHIFSPITPMAFGDYFPFLRWLTFYGAEKKIQEKHRKRDAFLQSLIDEHRKNNSSPSVTGGEIGRTLIDVMLKLQESEPEFYTDNMIKGMIQVMLIAGPHSTVITTESVLSSLMSHPEVFKTARDEIDNHVGQSRLIDDADLAKLPCLYCIINETLRLCPVVSVLPPHESSTECTVGGYHVPAGTQLLVNSGAVHMDPELWKDPEMFKPERFQQNEEEKVGCKFIPFGSGRRQCPGAGLATRLIALLLGTLIQCFEWEKAEEGSVKIIFQPREALTKVLGEL